jgi:hypothetical protein
LFAKFVDPDMRIECVYDKNGVAKGKEGSKGAVE